MTQLKVKRDRAAMCEGKAKYTYQQAARAVKRKGGCQIYKCPWCKSWHVGGKSNAKS